VEVPVQIEQSALHRLIFQKAFLEPVLGLPESFVCPIYPVPGQPLTVLWTFLKMVQKINKIGQVFLMDIKKVVRLGTDHALDKIGIVL
jgi:hypothetical protein